VLYLISLPLGYKSYRDQARAAQAASPAGEVTRSHSSPTVAANLPDPPHDDRPERLH
jgi:CDP-diacylglycerol--serine O-phosphatidyltransferase